MREFEKILINGGVGVLPTDTIYGLVGSALSPKAVARIYKLRLRNPRKPLIILIGSLKDLSLFNIKTDDETKKLLGSFWPGKVSVILPCPYKKFFYLHRGKKTLAFRLPKDKSLIKLLEKTGPLAAPSANLEGLPPAKTIKEAKNYFSEAVDFYVNRGRLVSSPSTLIAVRNGRVFLKRQGIVKIGQNKNKPAFTK